MAANLTVTKKIENDSWVVGATVTDGSDIPSDIFLYVNEAGVPGDFVAVCSLSDYQRYQLYTGTNIPVFGNKYMKLAFSSQTLPISADIDTYITGLLNAATTFRLEYLGLGAQTIHTYPI